MVDVNVGNMEVFLGHSPYFAEIMHTSWDKFMQITNWG